MSYLDQLSQFQGDLNTQHEQMSASITNIRQGIKAQFDDEYNKALESLEVAGGALGVSGIGIGGVHKSMKGLKAWNDKRLGKNQRPLDVNTKGKGEEIKGKPIETTNRELPDNPLRTKGKGLRLDGGEFTKPIKETPKSNETFPRTKIDGGKVDVIKDDGAKRAETQFNKQAKGAYEDTIAKTAPKTGGEGQDFTSIDRSGEAEGFLNDIEGSGLRGEYGTVKTAIEDEGNVVSRIATSKNVSSVNAFGDDILGGSSSTFFDKSPDTYKNLYKDELPKGWGDEYTPHSDRMRGTVGDGGSAEYRGVGKTTTLAQTQRDGAQRYKVKASSEFIGNEQREKSITGADLGGDDENFRATASNTTNIEDKVDYEPIETKYDNPLLSISEERQAPLPDPAQVAEPAQNPRVSTVRNSADRTRTRLGRPTGENPLAEPTIIQPEPASTSTYNPYNPTDTPSTSSATTGERSALANARANAGTTLEEIQSGIATKGNALKSALGIGEETAGGLSGLLGGGGAELGEGVGEKIAQKGIMSAVGEMGAIGVASAGFGALAPVADVVGAVFMIAGLVQDLTEHPDKVPDFVGGGVSGKIGFDAGAIGGDNKGGVGIV